MRAGLIAFALVCMAGCGSSEAPQSSGHHAKQDDERLLSEDAVQVQSLDVYVDQNTMHLLTGEYRAREKSRTLWHRRSLDGGKTWTEPVRVDAGASPVHGFERGNDAQIAAAGDKLMALWTTSGTGFGNSGPLVAAISEDAGKTWTRRSNPADDNSTGGHAFVDLIADDKGAFHLVWLDNRNGAQGLRYTRSADAGGAWLPNATLDAKTCECCWNTLASAGKKIYALYRGHAPRDMLLAQSADAGESWKQIGHVGAFDWKVNACPHAGGALTVDRRRGQTMHAVVWTGRDDALGLHHLASADAGKSWSAARRLGGETARHADLAADESGGLAAVWDERTDSGSAIFGSISRDGGLNWSQPGQLSESTVKATHPRIIASRSGFRVFWTEHDAGAESVWKMIAFEPS